MNKQSPESRREQMYAGPGIAEISVIVPEPGTTFDSRLLASYRLGRNCFGLWMWHNVFWEMPDNESTWNGVTLSVAQLRRDRLVLADVIHQNAFGELARVLDDLERMAEALIAGLAGEGEQDEYDFGSPIAPGRRHWDELKILLDRPIDPQHPLRSIFDLGASIGEYQLKLCELTSVFRPPAEVDAIPDVYPIGERARLLPVDLLRRIPQLESFARHFGAATGRDQGRLLADFLGRNPKVFTFYARGLGVGVQQARQLADWLDDSVADALALMLDLTEPPKPKWISGELRLSYNGMVIRKVKSGSDISDVLDAFEQARWVNPVTFPKLEAVGVTKTKLNDLKDSLNNGLLRIKFHGDGTGRGLEWRPVAPDESP